MSPSLHSAAHTAFLFMGKVYFESMDLKPSQNEVVLVVVQRGVVTAA